METVQGAATLGRFQYDFQGRRTKKIGEDGIRQYVYDQTSLLSEIDSAGLQVAKYDYGSDRLISLTRFSISGSSRRFYSLDGLRSVTNLTDDTGTVSASYHLDTWGNYRFPTELDAPADPDVAGKNRFGFTGYLFDKETGLYNAKARYFDPQLGRFLTQDSYLGSIDNPPSLHRYFYANANPTRYVDPTGHAAEQQRVKQALTIDGQGVVFMETEVTVDSGGPTVSGLEERARQGQLSQGDAAVQGVGAIFKARDTPDHEKSYARNLAEKTVGNVAETLAAPGVKTLEGLANQDPEKFVAGLAETALAGATPLIVKEGGGALVSKAVEKAPWLAKDIKDLGGAALERGKVVLEGATESAKRVLQSEVTFDPNTIGSLGGNIKFKVPPKPATGGIGPVLKGRAGEALSEAEALAAGETVRGKQVTFELPSGKRTRPDLLTEPPPGGLKVREAKNGPTAVLTPGQKELEATVQAGGTVTPRGANAQKAGLTPGKPIKIQRFEEDRY